MTERRIDVAAYWREHAEAWRNGRREIALTDAMPRIGGVENPQVYSRPAMRMPDMREGAERVQRKRRKRATDR